MENEPLLPTSNPSKSPISSLRKPFLDPSSSSSPPLNPSSEHKPNLHRSHSAPAFPALHSLRRLSSGDPKRCYVIPYAFLFLFLYLALGVAIYCLFPSHFSSVETHSVVDALYFCTVTTCTIGYGDVTPTTPFSKLFSIAFVLFGFVFIHNVFCSMVLGLQESLVNVDKERMHMRAKVGFGLAVVLLCLGLGTAFLRFAEELGWLDSFYLSVMSATTVGYGDRAFRTLRGRLFASVWLLVSTLAVARAFLYLAEARIDKRRRQIAKWVLAMDMTVSEFLAADIDHDGFVSKSEFVLYKLKEMGMISEKDTLQIGKRFDQLDTGNCGKITITSLTESHRQ